MKTTPKPVPKTADVSQLKLELQSIIKNIQQLEKLQSVTQSLNPNEVDAKIAQTEVRLKHVESAPIGKFARIIRKRQKNRTIQSRARKAKKPKDSAISRVTKTTTKVASSGDVDGGVRLFATAKKLNERWARYHDAQRFLRTFELLKMLHLARGQDVSATRQFSARLDRPRALWNRILLDNKPHQSAECHIEDQWNEALFGAKEQTYYVEEEKVSDFLRIRYTWDSYLTRSNKYGSSIPIGWVLPRSDANSNWQQYLSK